MFNRVKDTLLCPPLHCTGCMACVAICPLNCIAIRDDREGFTYPDVAKDKCCRCGKCSKICPILSSGMLNRCDANSVYAAWHLDAEARHSSSSGGVFTAIAEEILDAGGVVIGSAYGPDLMPEHCIVTAKADLVKLRGSKYVQSRIRPALYHDIKQYMEEGRTVLFVGTPCQVAGVRAFLSEPYTGLLCVDLVCRGVPSPLFFRKYLASRQDDLTPITDVCFRSKETGWKLFSVKVCFGDGHEESQKFTQDPYMRAFLKDYCLRRACYVCRFAKWQRTGDITLGDFWGVGDTYPAFDTDNEGVSLVMVNTELGRRAVLCKGLFLGHADMRTAIHGQHALVRPVLRPIGRSFFYKDLNRLNWNKMVRRYGLIEMGRIGKYIVFPRRVVGKLWKIALKIFDHICPRGIYR